MTSGNPMVDDQEQYDIDSTSSYQEELNTTTSNAYLLVK